MFSLPIFCARKFSVKDNREIHSVPFFILSFCPHQHAKTVAETLDEGVNICLGVVGRKADADRAIGVGGGEAEGGECAAGGAGMG